MHIHLFEFEDYAWFPHVLRRGATDYLHFLISRFHIYDPAPKIVKELMDKTDITEILDLCSGGGGGVDIFQKNLSKLCGRDIKLTLSDKFPNLPAFEEMKNENIDYITDSIDARHVPPGIKKMRTMFSAFHHFNPQDAKAILEDAARSKMPIAIFEGMKKNIISFLGILIFTIPIFFLITPFMKPFKLSRLFFTYLIPLIPITTTWDGIVSILRIYTPKAMLKMANEVKLPGYNWKAGEVKTSLGNTVYYLLGLPARE